MIMRVVYIDGLGREWPAEIYLEKEVYRCSIFPGSVAVVDTGTLVRYIYHHDDQITGEHIKAEQLTESNKVSIINIAAMFMPSHYLMVKLAERKLS